MFGSLLWGYGLSGIRPAIESAANRGKAATGSSKRFEVKSLQSAEAERCVSVGRNGRATVQATSAARKVCSEIEQLVVLGNLRFSPGDPFVPQEHDECSSVVAQVNSSLVAHVQGMTQSLRRTLLRCAMTSGLARSHATALKCGQQSKYLTMVP